MRSPTCVCVGHAHVGAAFTCAVCAEAVQLLCRGRAAACTPCGVVRPAARRAFRPLVPRGVIGGCSAAFVACGGAFGALARVCACAFIFEIDKPSATLASHSCVRRHDVCLPSSALALAFSIHALIDKALTFLLGTLASAMRAYPVIIMFRLCPVPTEPTETLPTYHLSAQALLHLRACLEHHRFVCSRAHVTMARRARVGIILFVHLLDPRLLPSTLQLPVRRLQPPARRRPAQQSAQPHPHVPRAPGGRARLLDRLRGRRRGRRRRWRGGHRRRRLRCRRMSQMQQRVRRVKLR